MQHEGVWSKIIHPLGPSFDSVPKRIIPDLNLTGVDSERIKAAQERAAEPVYGQRQLATEKIDQTMQRVRTRIETEWKQEAHTGIVDLIQQRIEALRAQEAVRLSNQQSVQEPRELKEIEVGSR